jgi:hypothetical protein
MSRDQHAGQNYDIKVSNKSFERAEQFKYLGTSLTNQNFIYEGMTSRLKLGNACYRISAESSVFQFAIQKYRDKHKQNYNFACCLGVKLVCSH